MRKSDRFPTVLVISIGLFCPSFARADQPLPQSFNNSRHGFSISFPAGWAQMPPSKLESANRTAAAQHPEWKRPVLHYGYQMTNSAGFAFPPYVVIRVTDTDQSADPKAVGNDLEKSEDLPQGVQRDKPTFDQALNVVVQRNRVNIAGVPPVEVSIACFLTKRSIIKMLFYTPPAENGGTAVPIQEIINNVQIHDGLKLSQPAPASRVGLIVALLAMVAIAVVLARAKPAKHT